MHLQPGLLIKEVVEEEKNNASLFSKNEFKEINQIIQENLKDIETQELEKEEIDLEYTTNYKKDKKLPKGIMQVEQEGKDGKQEITIKKTYKNGELIKEEEIQNKIIKSSVNKVVIIGDAEYTSNYKIEVGDILYVTPESISIKQEPKEDSNKIVTINKSTEVKLLEIQNEWYRVKCGKYNGWVKKESLTYLNQSKIEELNTNTTTKSQLLSGLSFEMNLNKKSGLSIEQFSKALSNNSSDKNKVFSNNSQYFYYAEQQYNINGIFIAAIGIHESAWGTSSISNDKKNLFGYGAYDRSPYKSAYDFKDYNEGIDLIARVLVKYYLNPKGTSIYDNQIATGSNYNGSTLSGVNKKYATDSNWAKGVYKWMSYLYNKL